jgi:putative acetyltransferase
VTDLLESADVAGATRQLVPSRLADTMRSHPCERERRVPQVGLPALTEIDMHVRRAMEGDRPRLLGVWERSVRATHHFLDEADIAALRPLVAEELGSDAVDWWVLLSAAETVIGFLGYSSDTIEALFIDPDYHGHGGGTLLVALAQSLGTGALAVDVNEANDAARRFYESLGFAVVNRSSADAGGRPFPILHMKRGVAARPSRA